MQRTLPPLRGTAPEGSWRMGNADREQADGRLAVFAIVTQPKPNSFRLLGTGFYLTHKGGFATAAHVARDARHCSPRTPRPLALSTCCQTDVRYFDRSGSFFIIPERTSPLVSPRFEPINTRTGKPYPIKLLSITSKAPQKGAAISAWSYPLHAVDNVSGDLVQLHPDFYNGEVQDFFQDCGPSVKINPPYYQTNIHLYGASSGGPVFNFDGEVFGVASCSYGSFEDENDVAFVTPASTLLEIEIPECIGQNGSPMTTLGNIARLGRISAR